MKTLPSRLISISAVLAVAGLSMSACSTGSTASRPATEPSVMTMAQADADCNQAIIADAVVTAQTLKACNTANVPTSYPCSHGSRVYEAYIPTGKDPPLNNTRDVLSCCGGWP